MTGQIITASRSALASAAEREKLGQLHPVLRPEPMAMHPDYAKQKADELDAELKQAGLLDRDGRPKAGLVDWLIPLCKPSMDYVAYCSVEGKVVTVLSALTSAMGVVAVARDDEIYFREIRQDELLDAVFGELPELLPAQGELVTLNLAKVRQERESVMSGVPNRTIKQLREIDRLPAIQTIDITMHTYDGGHRRRFRNPVGIKVTDRGDYFSCLIGAGRDEELWTGPATRPNLHKAIDALRADLVQES
ncbi:MAG: hypothetical protein GEU86_19760 [Actinophytocola sp.]|nr:hypothetical protein [Actinophytocola sp.]